MGGRLDGRGDPAEQGAKGRIQQLPTTPHHLPRLRLGP